MIEESYVSFNTAKLLKEAGFDEVCSWAYYRAYNWCLIHERNSKLCLGYYSRPTQALAARWLREVHDIDVTVIPCEDGSYVYDILHEKKRIISSAPMKEEYEKVLEYGLFMAIKLIKK